MCMRACVRNVSTRHRLKSGYRRWATPPIAVQLVNLFALTSYDSVSVIAIVIHLLIHSLM